jgi:hypothetical protein|tara:strand:+ start:422 stop:604 length:183 start_codon:yes stop_codon:yes gene_type:complete
MDFILLHWQEILLALLVAARAIVSLLPSDAPAIKVFGWLDTIITALVGGDKRKDNNKKNN